MTWSQNGLRWPQSLYCRRGLGVPCCDGRRDEDGAEKTTGCHRDRAGVKQEKVKGGDNRGEGA